MKKVAKKKNPLVFMDVSVDGDPAERMVFELFPDVAPKTAENFRALCTGEKGIGPKSGRPLHYKGSFFHHIIRGSFAQGGDFVKRDGTCGESIYVEDFPVESPSLKHDGPGLLSMAIADRDTLGSHFIVTFEADRHLDRKHVVFGKLAHGHKVLRKIENAGDENGRPTVTVKIINCGDFSENRKKANKLKIGKDVPSDANNHEARRKGKHKKSFRDRRKRRRRYSSSESESSSDTELESSESGSDSDLDLSSSSYTSSPSDDRRKKRKRSSKRDKYRRGKRSDKHQEKRRKKRDKRSKRRARRTSDSTTDSESRSESSSDSDELDVPGKDQKQNNHSQKTGCMDILLEKTATTSVKKYALLFWEEVHKSPNENGEHRSNGIEADAKSDGSGDRKPDIVDDYPEKSRSRSTSPKRHRSMSISPRSLGRSPSVSPKRSLSRSPCNLSRSPSLGRARSISRSPVRSDSSSSPVRSVSRSPASGRKGRNISGSPLGARPRRNVSESPVRSPPGRSESRSPRRTLSRKSISRSPIKVSRRSLGRSPIRSPRSMSRSSGRAPSRRISRSPFRPPIRNNHCSYSRSPSPAHWNKSPPDRGRSLSRSVSPDGSPKRIRRGRDFSQRYSYARQYRTPSASPVRSYRYGGRSDHDRYSSYRRYSPRRYPSPPRVRSPPRYRSRRSRTRSVSRSPPYHNRRYSCSCSPIRSRSPVEIYRSRVSPRAERRSLSRSRSPLESKSSLDSQSPKRASKDRSRSLSGSLDGKKGLVSYGDGSPDSAQR
ncbi:LOW QUALITY PROTEIN: peptidyl-prolyl cis-trans isomerase CYP95-like [Juglans microcarpa x Juglans regia]|uniref:LOW QUALITY PROTEIN: peptidyl-prolyl cis-trans isomerase CYP95-like n=1 Tax=Juglans microcarpa x Juglans regia TaxID=2249226 RepID=UPI001B7F1CF7|nr:LOW QUALITY PROTEIN: peptidyl-prolyl cis-trans isomerase CYP95-like [Juglans microcarpa x Juglans regia]